MTELEAVVEEVQERFQSLDQQMSRAGQTATKVGDRLQVMLAQFCTCFFCSSICCCPRMHCNNLLLAQSAENMRSKAEEAITSIQYIQSFAACTHLAELPELFQDSSQLPQAAVSHVLCDTEQSPSHCPPDMLTCGHLVSYLLDACRQCLGGCWH